MKSVQKKLVRGFRKEVSQKVADASWTTTRQTSRGLAGHSKCMDRQRKKSGKTRTERRNWTKLNWTDVV